jgi:hypothetical protein
MEHIVFILGAGSSIPFGYPSGPKLVDLILDSLNQNYFYTYQYKSKVLGSDDFSIYSLTQGFTDYSLFIRHGFPPELITEFEVALKNSNKDSIDSFLLERTEFYDIGKFAIANCILRCEIPTEFFFVQKNWLNYLWNKINATRDKFISSKISFITFNYDRVLEYYFYNSLKHAFRLNDSEIINVLKPILHLHGVVGNLPWQDVNTGFDYNYDGQLINNHYPRVANASEKIKIIFDKIDREEIFEQAFELISYADRIYALGFGFHNLNLERLRIKDVKKQLLCSSYGLTRNECFLIESKYPTPSRLMLDGAHDDNLDFLRNNLIL